MNYLVDALVENYAASAFVWGECDCFTFFASVVALAYNVDVSRFVQEIHNQFNSHDKAIGRFTDVRNRIVTELESHRLALRESYANPGLLCEVQFPQGTTTLGVIGADHRAYCWHNYVFGVAPVGSKVLAVVYERD